MVHQTAGSSNHDLGLLLQLLGLAYDAGTAIKDSHTNALVISQQTPQFIADLNGQLTGGSQDKALDIGARRVDMFNHGNAKRKGFAGAGGSLGNDILPLHKLRDGLGLNGRGIAVALLLQGLQHGFG